MSNVFDNQMGNIPFEMQTEGQNVEVPETEVSETVSEVEPSPEVQTEGQGGENVGEEVPEWQKEFKSPDELYQAYANTKKSYDHIRPKLTQTTQQLAELKKKATNPQPEMPNNVPQAQNMQQTAQPQQVPQAYAPQKSAEDIVKGFIEEMNRPIAEQMNTIMMEQEINNVANKYQDFAEYGEQINKVMESNPQLWNVPNAIENAYKLAKFDSIGSNIDQAIQEATKQAYADKQVKVLGSDNKARPSNVEMEPKQKTAEEEIADSIVGAAYRPKTIFF